MQLVLDNMNSASNRVNILILDADFESSSNSGGLATMNAPIGTFIAYATAPDEFAMDGIGDSRNSPFTGALVGVIRAPGLRIEEVFRKVRVKVHKDTEGRQIPWIASSLIEDFYFLLPSDEPTPSPDPPR